MSVWLPMDDARFALRMAEYHAPRAKDPATRSAFEHLAAHLRKALGASELAQKRKREREATRRYRTRLQERRAS